MLFNKCNLFVETEECTEIHKKLEEIPARILCESNIISAFKLPSRFNLSFHLQEILNVFNFLTKMTLCDVFAVKQV